MIGFYQFKYNLLEKSIKFETYFSTIKLLL